MKGDIARLAGVLSLAVLVLGLVPNSGQTAPVSARAAAPSGLTAVAQIQTVPEDQSLSPPPAATSTPTNVKGVASTGTEPAKPAGGYSLGAGGKLGIEVGGPPSSNLYGQVNSSAPATLGGTLDVTLANGFSPTFRQSFPILHFASRNGTFATINLPSSNGTPLFTASLTATTLTLMRQFNVYLPFIANQTAPR